MNMDNWVKILSTSEHMYSAAKSPNHRLKVVRNLGFVDATVYRKLQIDQNKYSLDLNDKLNNNHAIMRVEQAIGELNQLISSKVVALSGNCIQGYRFEINTLKHEYGFT